VKAIEEYELEKIKKDKVKEQDESEIPVYLEQLKLDDERKKIIVKEIFDEFEEIKKERDAEKLEQKWDNLDNQYDGKLVEDSRVQFNLDQKVTKIKVDRITNMIMQAFLKSDPKYSVSPRPEFERQGGEEVCQKQSDFLDYKLDNLPFREPTALTVHSAVLKDGGILKIFHCIKREKRKRDEHYKGNPLPKIDPNTGKAMINPETGEVIIENKGLEEFLRNWPDERDSAYAKQLAEGKEINFVANYTETTYNDPAFKNIDLKNFYCRLSTEGYEGLKTTKLTVERQKYSYWELRREEERGFFSDIDKLIIDEKKGEKKKGYQTEEYDILECVFYTKLKDSDKEELKRVFWIEEQKRIMIGAIEYPYYAIDCYYNPHFVTKKKAGFYQPGPGADLTDSSIAENAILNFTLEAAWTRNMITPIIEDGSQIGEQFLSKKWTHGIPLVINKGESVDFLQKYMQNPDLGGLLTLIQYVKKGQDDVSRVTGLMTGRESPTDPSAPATKTIALLKESGVGIEDYILTIAPAFNRTGEILLQMYYQMATDGVKYRPKPERVVGGNPFSMLTRAEMVAKTSIQVMAYAFDFDKLNEKREDVALWQMFRGDPLIAQRPESIYVMAKQIIKGWSNKWGVIVDRILPPLNEFKKEQLMIAAQAVAAFVKSEVEKAKITGVAPEFNPEQLLGIVQMATQESITPPPPEVVREREKAQKEGG